MVLPRWVLPPDMRSKKSYMKVLSEVNGFQDLYKLLHKLIWESELMAWQYLREYVREITEICVNNMKKRKLVEEVEIVACLQFMNTFFKHFDKELPTFDVEAYDSDTDIGYFSGDDSQCGYDCTTKENISFTFKWE